MRKLIIQIPCYNEEATIGVTLDALPRKVDGFDSVEWLIIDDGSTDQTTRVAREHGADHIVSHPKNRGLSRTFMTGLDAAIRLGADVIVNTDADNQYNADDIPLLVAPILAGRAEIVVGERPIAEMPHFTPLKKILQRLGSGAVRLASGTNIPDAPSGFRAFTRAAAMRINVFDTYTYTLETIIQAGRKNMAITSVPIRTNDDLRPSRLVKSIPGYVRRSLLTIIRIFMTYRPFHFFAVPGFIAFIMGLIPALRFFYFYIFMIDSARGHIQSLLFAVFLMGTGCALITIGLLADLIGVNRILLEDIRWRLRCMEFEKTEKVKE
jgi:glycosyltransferase involved in cell wall biosynthesis